MSHSTGSLSISVSGTDAAADVYLENLAGEKITITSLEIMPSLAVSTHAANYITTAVTAGGVTLVTAHTNNSSGGSAMVAGTSIPFVFAAIGVGTALELAAGGTLRVQVAKAGTGPAYAFAVNAKYSVLGRGF